MTFHHVGIPTAEQRPGETYLEAVRLHVTDADASPYHIEWLRFEEGSPMPRELQTKPHLAFCVDDLKSAMEGKTVLLEPFEAMPGLMVGFVLDGGAAIEFMQKTA
jgi:hypothetical protein